MATYKVDSSGTAPKGAVAGDFIQTAGGTYEIVNGTAYKGMSKEQLSQQGIGFNPASGLYSRKVNSSGGEYGPSLTPFDGGAWKDNFIKQQTAGLDKNYGIDSGNLTKTYNANKSQYQDQITDVNRGYKDALTDLQDSAYINNILAKQQASSRGLTSSGQGIALGQSVLNQANKDSVGLWRSREETVNSIQNAINQLSATYHIDRDMLLSAYNADKLGVMGEAELKELEHRLSVDMSNAGIQNNWDMTKYQTENDNTWRQKELDNSNYWRQVELDQRNKELAMQQAMARSSYGGGYSSGRGSSSSASSTKLDKGLESAFVHNYDVYMANTYGDNWLSNLTATQRRNIDNAKVKVGNGNMSSKEYENLVNTYYKNYLMKTTKDAEAKNLQRATPKTANRTSFLDRFFKGNTSYDDAKRKQVERR